MGACHISHHDGPGPRASSRYRIVRAIGRGSFGEVFEAEDALLGRQVAVKVFPYADRIPTLARRALLAEAKIAAAAGRASVQIYDFVEIEQGSWLVMELVRGGSLRRWAERPRSEAQVQTIAASLTGRVAVMHELGLVHGDLHPGNVLVRADDDVALADFGLARAIEETKARRGAHEVHWSAPEVLAGKPISPPSDVYSLALILDWLYRKMGYPCPEPVKRGMAKPSARRPQDGGAFARQLTATDTALQQTDADEELEALLRDAALAVRAGKAHTAVGILERAMRHAPLDLRPRRRLALLRWSQGERQSAIWTLEAARRLEPSDRMTKAMLANWADVVDET